jgi:ferredoxin
MACLEPRGEMPGFEWEIGVAEEEGIVMCPGRTFKEVVLEDDQIVGVRCVEVNFRGFVGGRPDMDEIPDTEHILPADIVIWAIGQGADLSFLPEDGSVETREPAGIQTDSDMMTSVPGVFVAGDVHRGVTFFVVDAIGEGHKAARGIDHYLRGDLGSPEPLPLEAVEYDKKEIKTKLSQASQEKRVQIPSIPPEERELNFYEVDLAITEEQALAEAQRCLICGPCSECQACVEACKAGAIAHNQQETSAHLNLDAVIYADMTSQENAQGVHYVAPDDPLSASAAVANVLASIGVQTRPLQMPVVSASAQTSLRIGAFVCECGDHISSIIDTEHVCEKLASLPGVVHTQILPFSCSQEAADTIQSAVDTHHLDKAVLAACSCCLVDQACYSCTYQRLRSRRYLGVLPGIDGHFPRLDGVDFEFVNIREQCAWVHADNPEKATAKAIALTTAAVARVRGEAARPQIVEPIERSVLILGDGEAATISKQLIKKQGINAVLGRMTPSQIVRTDGKYLASKDEENLGGQALILAPSGTDEAERLLTAFGPEELRPRVQLDWGELETHRPGVYFCDPELDPDLTGKAAAARVGAWLGRISRQMANTAMVDPARCRACGTCVEICEFGAPELTGEVPLRAARIDSIICTGCGTCVAHCPSDAISYPNGESAELETTLSAILALGD